MRVRAPLATPYLFGLLALVALPALAALALAFTDFSGIGAPEPVGLDNFSRLLGDAAFWRSLGNSLVYAAIAVPLRIAAAVAFALLLHRRGTGIAAARTTAYVPTVVPDVAYALLWLWLLNPLFGPLTLGIEALGLPSPDWLTDPWGARVGLAVMGAFQIGEAFVVALAARRSIPAPLYEAARVEGAGPWFAFRSITLPLMAPLLALLALRDVILSLQLNFVPALIVTGGGPRYATTYVSLYAYQQGFRYFRLGYAAAISVALFVLTGLALLAQARIAKRWRVT